MTFSAMLSAALADRGWTQTELRKRLEMAGLPVKPQTISGWILENKAPTYVSVILDVLGIAGDARRAWHVAAEPPLPIPAAVESGQ